MSYIPYVPCDECKRKGEKCNQCAFRNAKLNYERALSEIIKLRKEQGKPVTIIV